MEKKRRERGGRGDRGWKTGMRRKDKERELEKMKREGNWER